MLKLKTSDPEKAKVFFEQKLAFTAGPAEVSQGQRDHFDFNFIDVRAADDYEEGHAAGALSLPQDQWKTFKGLTKDKANVLYCYSQQCHLAARAAHFFASNGYPVIEMEGGFEAWKDYELPVEKGQPKEKAA